MPRPFYRLSRDEFADLLARFPFTRRITAVHMHHTWKPNHAQDRGLETIEGMWRYHTQELGWSDIAQHVTIDSLGFIWTGRNWNRSPASAAGFNGNSVAGPFMFEMIGDFDIGRDTLRDPQRRAVLEVIARVQKRFDLPAKSLHFHNEMSTKTCPGSSIQYEDILGELDALRAELDARDVEPRDLGPRPFADDALEVRVAPDRFIELVAGDRTRGDDPAEAELPERESATLAASRDFVAERTSRGDELTAEELSSLRPHVVNLSQGRFSSEGRYGTTKGDVDAIFDEHLRAALEMARQQHEPLRIVIYAHGGLVKEASGLSIARKHVRWWLSNHVFPIYFVWETGLFETLGHLLIGSQQRRLPAVTRDFADIFGDPIIEDFARRFGGPKIWGGMKESARLAAEPPDGGALYVAGRLKQFCDEHGGDVELHAVGHSAGSNFHAHFIPAALDLGVPAFRTLHLLAPAMRTKLFGNRLAPRLGNGVDHATIYTMRKDLERADDCGRIYRKSLLYLIYHALEREPRTPILGLEESLREDAALSALFGLKGTAAPHGDVIWSTTATTSGLHASTSTSHGGFDDDAPTMESVARRILGASDTAPLTPYPIPDTTRDAEAWTASTRWGLPPGSDSYALTPAQPASSSVSAILPVSTVSPGGRRVALCVGIDRYAVRPLAGCVADAHTWSSALGRFGFATSLLLDERATRAGILGALVELVGSSRAGDVVVFQYSGHGTTLVDESGDETSGNNAGYDEAIVPIDFTSGAYLVDDDVGAIFERIPDGVNVTCFIDCCHSGTISRFGVGLAPDRTAGFNDERPRFIPATAEMDAAHSAFRRSLGGARIPRSSRGREAMREILFSACRDVEVAWETNGHGDFTTRATGVLLGGIDGLSHEGLQTRIVDAFGPNARQHPELFCPPAARTRRVLESTGARVAALGTDPNTALAEGLRLLARSLER